MAGKAERGFRVEQLVGGRGAAEAEQQYVTGTFKYLEEGLNEQFGVLEFGQEKDGGRNKNNNTTKEKKSPLANEALLLLQPKNKMTDADAERGRRATAEVEP